MLDRWIKGSMRSNLLVLFVVVVIAVLFSELLVHLQLRFFWSEEHLESAYWLGFWTPLIDGLIVASMLLYARSYYEKHLKEIIRESTEKITRQNEAFETLFEKSSDGILIIEDNAFVQCNEKVVKMLRYDSKEALLKTHPSQLSPESQPDGRLSYEKAEEMMRLAYEEGANEFEWVHTRADGEDFWAEVVLTPISLAEREILHVVWRDISDRKVMEQKLREHTEKLEHSKQQLQTYLDVMLDGFAVADVDTKRFVFCNKAFEEITGYTLKELLSMSIMQIHPSGSLEDVIDQFQKNTEGGLHKEIPVLHKDGHMRYFDVSVSSIIMDDVEYRIGGFRDVSEKLEMEKKLHHLADSLEQKVAEQTMELLASKESLINQYSLLQNIVDNVPVRIFWKDRDGVYLGANRLFLQDAGLTSKEEIIGKDDFEMTWGDTEGQQYRDDDIALMQSGRSRLLFEETQTDEHGKVMDLLTSKIPLKDIHGKTIGVLGAYEDITERKVMEQRNRVQEQQLLQQSRLAQMGEMISMIAHQWRQPLGAIAVTATNMQFSLELEEFDLHTPEGRQECDDYFMDRLGKIERFVHDLSNTIDDFRNFYRLNKASVMMSLEEVMNKALNIIQSSLDDDGVEMIYDYRSNVEMSLYDSEMMQVILNILKNAQDNFKERGVQSPQIRMITQEKRIEICDNGGGIPDEIIEKVFDPYYSTKDERNGTGLGLYMSKMIIEDHHKGHLWAENRDQGVCFMIEMVGNDEQADRGRVS